MAVARDPEDDASRILVHVKANLCLRSAPLRFHVEEGGPNARIAWDGIAAAVAADRLMDARPQQDGALIAATNFLKEALEPGPMPSRELEELAAAQGITRTTYDRARFHVARACRIGGVGAEGAWVTSLKSSTSSPG
jgi:hypothetical protein